MEPCLNTRITISCIFRLSSSKDSRTNGHSTIIPLEVIYEDKTVPKSTPKGQTNPEFIGDDDDDNDIYKAQLLLFLKQAHLIRPNIYPDEQDNQSDTSEYSRSTSRKPSAVSRTSGTIEDTEEQAHDVKTSHESNSVTFAVSFFLVGRAFFYLVRYLKFILKMFMLKQEHV